MKLTVVLVTQPSRLRFFNIVIESISEALAEYPSLELLVIFNGSSLEGVKALRRLTLEFSSRVRFKIIEENSSMPDQVWNIMQQEDLAWVHMPGDDDIINFSTYRIFFDATEKDKSLVACGFSATVIDENGSATGKTIKPSRYANLEFSEAIAHALHKPPFVWPSLIFDFSRLPENAFSSRFVFDWWVGLQLLASGKIFISNHCLVKYRSHGQQESMLVKEARKRFEAEMMILLFITQESFLAKIGSLESPDSFMQILGKHPPIYGDPKFGTLITFLLHNRLKNQSNLFPQSEEYFSKYASQHGILFVMKEFPHVLPDVASRSIRLNFSGTIDTEICNKIQSRLSSILDDSGPNVGRIVCKHFVEDRGAVEPTIKIDCNNSLFYDNATLASEIIRQVHEADSHQPLLAQDLSSWERNLIFQFRRILRFARYTKRFFVK